MPNRAASGIRSDSRARGFQLPEMVRALRHRNFQLFFSGQLISLVGTWMDNIAEGWLVYRLTHSPLLLGVATFAGQIPVFLLAPLGGMIADRWDRRKVVIGTQAASMVIASALAGLTLSGRITVWEVVVLAACMGAVNAVDIPTRQAFLVQMVGRDDLMNAIALNSSMFNAARVVGPSIAGLIVAWKGEGWCFFINAVSYIAVIAGLAAMRIEPKAREVHVGSPLDHIAEGFRFARNTAPIRAILLLIALVSLVATPYAVLMPIFAARILHGNARTLGVLMGATGVGAVTGALVLAARSGVRGLGRWVALACGGFGLSLILFAFSHWYVLSVILLVPVGFCVMVQMASSNTLIQSMVPDRLRGRIMSIYSMMFMGMMPLGALLAGWLAGRIGAPWTVAIGGVGAIIAAIIFGRNLPKIRVEARQLIMAQGFAGGEPAQPLNSGTLS
ncbi:MAG TPA: MFS transporter [Candidatus Acidoferrales bacterium]|nr:MFS transporter [Candidatus Acidoferrales bacterium]